MKSLLIADGFVLKKRFRNYSSIISWNDEIKGSNIINFNLFIEENSYLIRDKYIDWVERLPYMNFNNGRIIDILKINNKYNFWWSSLIAQKDNIYRSQNINDILKIIAIDLWLKKNNINKVKLDIKSNNLKTILLQIINSNNIKIDKSLFNKYFNNKLVFTSKLSTIYLILNRFILGIFWFLNYLFSRISFRKAGLKEWKCFESDIILISYLFNLDNNQLSHNKYKSNYWGEVNRLIFEEKAKCTNIQFFIPSRQINSSSRALNYIDLFNKEKINSKHITIDSNLNLKTITNIFMSWMYVLKKWFLIRKYIRYHKLCNADISSLLKKDFIESFFGKNAIFSLYTYYQFKNLFSIKKLKAKTPVFYLLENQQFEYSLLSVLYEYNLKSIAICHTPISFWDLRFFHKNIESSSTLKRLIPEIIGVNNIYNFNEFQVFYNDICKIEAQRYGYLNSSRKKIIKDSKFSSKKNKILKILILGDSNKKNLDFHLSIIIKKNILSKKEFKFYFKPHPLMEKNCYFPDSYNINIVTDNLSNIIKNFDLVYAPSSSASVLDAYFNGIPTISSVNKGYLNFSPIKNFKGVYFVRTTEEFLYYLEKVFKSLNIDIQDYFFFDEKYKLWKNLIKSNLKYKKI